MIKKVMMSVGYWINFICTSVSGFLLLGQTLTWGLDTWLQASLLFVIAGIMGVGLMACILGMAELWFPNNPSFRSPGSKSWVSQEDEE